GYVCDTRNIAGSGASQITAVMEATEAVANDRDPMAIISDGGTREPGDIPKAIGAGADAVMIGSLFAGTDESPGEPVLIDGTLQNMVRGMASDSAFRDRQAMGDTTTDNERYVPEGRTIFTPYKGPVSKVISNLVGGLRSGMSYTGAHTIDEMKKRAKFQIIPSGTPEQRREMR
ncbi:MAG: Inosine-5'-monophosphate dehydrogenase, partial [Candidatus Gottesmanbacteria bacterium GW2011_GWA2_47_9]